MNLWSIKSKSIVVYILSALFLVSAIIFVMVFFLQQQVKNIEEVFVDRDKHRVENTYLFIRSLYEKKIADWGDWDDTYVFINDLNEEYVKSNLGEPTLHNLSVDEMLFYDSDGNLKYSVASEVTKAKEANFPEDLNDLFRKDKLNMSEVLNGNLKSGLLKTDDGVLLFAVHLISKSDGSGDPRGVILFGRYIDEWLVKDISNIAQVNVTFAEGDSIVQTDTTFFNTVTLPVLNSTSKIYLNVETKREIWTNSQRSFYLLIIITIAITLLSKGVNYVFLQSFVLQDLQKFREEIAEVVSSGGYGVIEKTGKSSDMDELREDINRLLQKLALLKEKEDFKLKELNDLNRLMVGREIKMADLKKIIADLKSKIK